MNRKKKSKEEAKAPIHHVHPYDDEMEWIGADFSKAPWTPEEIADFQRRLDSAFGAENAIVLAWSGDKRYWDGFYTDWFSNGLPKGKLEKKPILLFGQYDVNETDYMFVYPPRWLLLERQHPAQYEDSWESSSWVLDERMIGGKKRIRAEKPPAAFYTHLRTIAEHDDTLLSTDIPHCCELWMAVQKICYGRYRPPSEKDLEFVRQIRENMDREGVSQRNDQVTGEKLLMSASLATKHYMQRAAQQRATELKDFLMQDPYALVADVIKNKGITLSAKEIAECVEIGIDQAQTERLGR